MKRLSKRIAILLILMITIAWGFSGCTEEQVIIPVTEPTLEVTSEGEMIAYMVEDFAKDYYIVEELDTMVRAEIAEYAADNGLVNEDGEAGITVESVHMAEDGSKKVVVALKFANSEMYADYFEVNTFYGTVEEAVALGYELNAALTSVEDGELFGKEDAEKYAKKKILITDASLIVRCAQKILYVGTNAALTEQGFVDCTQSEGLKLIITK